MINNKIAVYYDNSIYVLQRIGGISIVFFEIIRKLKSCKQLNLHIIVNGENNKNKLFDDIFNNTVIEKETRLPRAILPFFPLLKHLPTNAIYHSTYNRYSFQKNIKRVLTIHDLGYEHGIMRGGFRRSVHLFFKKIAIRNADAIICVSQSTLNDLKHFYKDILNGKVIKVIYNGLSEEFLADTSLVAASVRPYIMYVGGRQAYKNFEKVVSAVSEMEGYDLLIAGGGDLNLEHQALLDAKLKSRYTVNGNLTTLQLKEYYTNAFCLVYPSSYEGFGLPLLEAMASGCPVVACDNSCIKEISADAAVLIPHADVEDIKKSILKLSNISFRESLVEKGKINATRFSWDRTVKSTFDLYEQIINS